MKKLLFILMATSLLLGMGYASPQKAYPKGLVNVTLQAGDIWNEGSGFQMLLDPAATAHGTLFPQQGNAILAPCGVQGLYEQFPYTIPENADSDCATLNRVLNGSATIQIPAGMYDFVICNPRLYGGYIQIPSAGSYSSVDDFVFEEGFNYTFIVSRVSSDGPAQVELIIEEVDVNLPGWVTDFTITPDPTGALTALLSWTNPAQTLNGATLTELTAVKIYQNNETEPVYVNSSPEIGAFDSFTVTVPVPGSYTFTVVAENSVGTGTPSSKTAWIGSEVMISTFPWLEDFENETFPPSGWNLYQKAGFKRWERNTETTTNLFVFSGNGAAFHEYGYIWDEYQESWLISPKIALPGSGSYRLEFWSNFYYAFYSNINDILISTTGNKPATDEFVLMKHLEGNEVADAVWQEIKISLDEYLGQEIFIAFRYGALAGNRWFIDDVKVTEVNPLDAAVEKIYGATTTMRFQPFKYKALVKNRGSEVLSNYTVALTDADGNQLSGNFTGPALEPEETAIVEMIWSPVAEGDFTIYAKVTAPGDPNPTNDLSPALQVTVLPSASSFTGTIGNGNLKSVYMPLDYNMNTSRAQTLYFDHELINREGVITHIHYFNNFVTPEGIKKPVKLWMLNTAQTNLDTWHFPFSDFTLVYDGAPMFPQGENRVTIKLDEPFIYTGQNLLVMSDRIYSDDSFNINDVFYSTKTPDFQKRSRYFNSLFNVELDSMHLISNGYGVDYHPNTNFTFVVTLGSLSGTVTDGINPVENVLVQMEGLSHKTTTDANGKYSFENLLPGNYSLKLTKHGYYEVNTDSVEVYAYINTELDVVLPPLPLYTVSGKITGNDAPNGIANAKVTLSGYESYSGTSDADGNYSIPDVYGEKEYEIKAEASEYQTYFSTVHVTGDIAHNILLNEIAYHVVDPVAELAGENVEIKWLTPGTSMERNYILDDGTAENGSTYAEEDANLSLGNMFNVNEAGEITSVDVYGKKYIHSSGRPLTIRIYNENRELAGESEEFVMPEDDWINIPLNNIPYSGTFYAMVFFPKFNSGLANFIGFDSNGPYSQDSLAYSCQWGIWFEHAAISGNRGVFMIRVNATSSGKQATYGAEASASKAMESYSVYRLLKGQPESEWTLLSDQVTDLHFTDSDWKSLPQGWYQWAVKVNYTNGVVSEPRFTNILSKNMKAEFTVHLTLNSNAPATGVAVTLTHQNENYKYVQTAENSTIIFPEVVKGTYKIEAKLKGYATYTATVEIEGNSSYDIALNEIFNVVINPRAEKVENGAEISWEDPLAATEKIFRFDSGKMDESLGFPDLAPNGVIGTCHRGEAKLTKIQWFLDGNTPNPAKNVDVYVFDLDVYGMPTSSILYHAGGVRTATMKWMEYEFPSPVHAPNGFFMALSRKEGEFLAIGVSEGTQEYPFMYMSNFYCFDYTSMPFTSLEGVGYPANFMIRAEGYAYGKEAKFGYATPKIPSETSPQGKAPVAIKSTPVVTEELVANSKSNTNSNSRHPLSYIVYRLIPGQNEPSWTLLSDQVTNLSFTDNTLYTQSSGNYQWAVRVKYTTGISEPRFTNLLQHTFVNIAENDLVNIQLYPNPFSNEIYISHPELVKSIQVTDIMGQIVKQASFNGKSIVTRNLSNGIYFITVERFTGEKTVHRMVNN